MVSNNLRPGGSLEPGRRTSSGRQRALFSHALRGKIRITAGPGPIEDQPMTLALFPFLLLVCQATTGAPPLKKPGPAAPLERSAYFAFVDRDFMFTVELVRPGVP